jgi:predicted Holliday junction resolvase-like endonuclease
MPKFIDPSSNWFYVSIVILIIVLFPVLKLLLWKLFSFDKKIEKILEQKKSSEVRLGKISETLAPFLDDFPVDPQKIGTSTVFLGQPIDYIHFDPDEGIYFIEVKSGNAKLNQNQKKIKELVKEGKIYWKELSIK